MMKVSKPPASPPRRTAARHPAIGAGGRTAARRVRMMKVSKPPASPPRRNPPRDTRRSVPEAGRRPAQSADDEGVEAAGEPPPRRTAAAGADTCARAAEAVREGGRGRHPESGPGGHAGMWIKEGARGGLNAPSKPIGQGRARRDEWVGPGRSRERDRLHAAVRVQSRCTCCRRMNAHPYY